MQRGNLDDLRGLCRRRAGAQLHQSRGEAGRVAVGAEPHDPRTRSAARRSAPDPHDAQRLAHGSGRAPASHRRPAVRGDRGRARRRQRASGEARRHHPDHSDRKCDRDNPGPEACEAAARIPGHQGRDHHRLWPDGHRRPALRRRRAQRRAGGEGHDRRADRAGHAHGGRRRAILFQEQARAEEARRT